MVCCSKHFYLFKNKTTKSPVFRFLFSELRHPGRLRLSDDGPPDPLVSHLLQRVQRIAAGPQLGALQGAVQGHSRLDGRPSGGQIQLLHHGGGHLSLLQRHDGQRFQLGNTLLLILILTQTP